MHPLFCLFDHSASSASRFGRRQFLSRTGLFVAAAVVPNFVLKAANLLASSQSHYAQFLSLSQFLLLTTSLNEQVAQRIHTVLSDRDAGFDNEVAALLAVRADQAWFSVSDFQASSLFQTEGRHRRLALSIVSAWYLGYVGTPSVSTAHDDAQFITYTQALMYQPTAQTLVIPSYVKWGTNYWAEPPILTSGLSLSASN